MSDAADSSVGGADAHRLLDIAKSGTLPDPDDDPLPWDAAWVDTFDAWSHREDSLDAVVLLFSQTPNLVGGKLAAQKLTLFAQRPQAPAPGVYVVGRAGTTYAWRVPTDADFDAACQAIQANADLNGLPMVVLGRKKRCMFYFPSGVGNDSQDPAEFSLARSEAALDWPKLYLQLEAFESECLNTLEMMPKIWAESGKWLPVDTAELVIHSYLLVALRMVFRGFTTLSEVNLPLGRADLLLQSRDPTVATRAVVELKVLRTFSCTGSTQYGKVKWQEVLEEGRVQALSYASRAGAGIKVLCAYDMRKDKSSDVLVDAKKVCSNEGVELCDFPVHNNVGAVRRTLLGVPSK